MGGYIHLKNNYLLKTVSADDILQEIEATNNGSSLFTGEIIRQLESDIADTVKDNKAISIPYIGTLRKNLVKQEFRTKYGLIKDARQCMELDDFKQYVKQLYAECSQKVYSKDESKVKENRFCSKNRKIYESKVKLLGHLYTNTWVHFICLTDVIPYDEEVEEIFKQIINENSNRKSNIGR